MQTRTMFVDALLLCPALVGPPAAAVRDATGIFEHRRYHQVPIGERYPAPLHLVRIFGRKARTFKDFNNSEAGWGSNFLRTANSE